MKKSPNDIDIIFQSHFEDHEMAVIHEEQLWQRIATIAQRRSRILFLFFFLFIATSGWLAYASLSNSNTPQSIPPNTTEPIANYDEVKVQNLILEAEALLETADKITEENSDRLIDEAAYEESNNQFSSVIPSASESTNKFKKSKNDYRSAHPIQQKTTLTTSSQERQSKYPTDLGSISNTNSTLSLKVKNTVVGPSSSQANPEVTPIEEIQILTKDKGAAPNKGTSIQDIQMAVMAPLQFTLTLPPLMLKNGMMDKCEIGNKNLNLFVDAYGLLAQPLEMVGLSALASDELQYLTDWNDRFSPLLSFGGGIAVGNEWANGISASVGIEYQRMESQYRTTQNVTEITTIFDPMAFFFIDENDQTVWVGDSVTSVTTYDRSVAHANSTTLINVPLHVSYNLVQSGPWKIKATLGGIVNLSMRYQGRFLESNQNLQVIDDNNQDSYVTSRLGTAIEAGVDFSLLLSPKWEAYLSPRYRYNRSSYWQESSIIDQSRDYVGLRMGVRYLFQQ